MTLPGIWFVFLGLVVGTLVGLTGLGGGVLMTPLLIISGLSPIIAIGTDILYAAITKSFASVLHIREKNVDFKIVGVLLSGSIPGLFVGYYFSLTILNNLGEEILNFILTTILSFILISISLVSLISEIYNRVEEELFEVPDVIQEEFKKLETEEITSYKENYLVNQQTFSLILGAFTVGILVQLTSVGSGILVTIILLNILPPRRVVGTEIVHAAILVGISSLLYFNLGFINFEVLWKIVLGAIFGIIIGVRLSKKVPAKRLKMILLIVILFAGLVVLLQGSH